MGRRLAIGILLMIETLMFIICRYKGVQWLVLPTKNVFFLHPSFSAHFVGRFTPADAAPPLGPHPVWLPGPFAHYFDLHSAPGDSKAYGGLLAPSRGS